MSGSKVFIFYIILYRVLDKDRFRAWQKAGLCSGRGRGGSSPVNVRWDGKIGKADRMKFWFSGVQYRLAIRDRVIFAGAAFCVRGVCWSVEGRK